MTQKLDYNWNLRRLMAAAGMFATTDLGLKLRERGITLSSSQVYRLVIDKPERLNVKVLIALVDILGCHMDELIEPTRTSGSRQQNKKRTSGSGGHFGSDRAIEARPVRARITTSRAE
jgi:hypothetical protein